MRLRCPQCSASLEATPGQRLACPACGHVARAPRAPSSRPAASAWAVLAINLVVPGLGSLLGGRREGWPQLLLWGVGIATIVYLIGFALVAAAWIWALLGSLRMLRRPTPAAPVP